MLTRKERNATALLERFTGLPDDLSDAATALVESLKINTISEKRRRGRLVVIKRRNIFGERGADLINFYFRVADITIPCNAASTFAVRPSAVLQ